MMLWNHGSAATHLRHSGRPAVTDQTPKMLSDLRRHWAPEAFVVSFKLETDAGLLLKKVCSRVH